MQPHYKRKYIFLPGIFDGSSRKKGQGSERRSVHFVLLCWWNRYNVYGGLKEILDVFLRKTVPIIKGEELWKVYMGLWTEGFIVPDEKGGHGTVDAEKKEPKSHGHIFWLSYN